MEKVLGIYKVYVFAEVAADYSRMPKEVLTNQSFR